MIDWRQLCPLPICGKWLLVCAMADTAIWRARSVSACGGFEVSVRVECVSGNASPGSPYGAFWRALLTRGRRALITRSACLWAAFCGISDFVLVSQRSFGGSTFALFPLTAGSNVPKGRQRDDQRLVVIDRGRLCGREVPTPAVRLDGAKRVKHGGRSQPFFRPNSSKTGSAAGVVNLFRE